MASLNVQYTVRAEYAAQNKVNIRRVINELRALGRTDITYSVFVADDGKTFIHWPFFASAEAEKLFSQLPAFQTFLAELQASHPQVLPKTTNLTLVASTLDQLSQGA
jgi:hypothetical protein